jgi:hypothetical protein
MPDKKLIIIGAPKSGTTSLARWLGQHPKLVLGKVKEPAFFTDFAAREWRGPRSKRFASTLAITAEDYEANFDNDKNAEWGIDASTDYLSCEVSPSLIEEYAKDHEVRLVCILRDPVERAFSEYAHTIRDGYQQETFAASLAMEPERIAGGWTPLFHHIRRSRYSDALARYMQRFGADRLLILPYESVGDGSVLKSIEGFMGLEPFDYDLAEKANVSTTHRNRSLKKLIEGDSALKRIGKALTPGPFRNWIKGLNAGRLEMTQEEAAAAYALLREDIARTQALIPFDARHWIREG